MGSDLTVSHCFRGNKETALRETSQWATHWRSLTPECQPSPSLDTPGRSGCDALRIDRCPYCTTDHVILWSQQAFCGVTGEARICWHPLLYCIIIIMITATNNDRLVKQEQWEYWWAKRNLISGSKHWEHLCGAGLVLKQKSYRG